MSLLRGTHWLLLLALCCHLAASQTPEKEEKIVKGGSHPNTSSSSSSSSSFSSSSSSTKSTSSTSSTSCREPGVEYPIGIDFDELTESIAKQMVLLIDVRQPWELKEFGQLPGSVNLPMSKIEKIVTMSGEEFAERYGFRKPKPKDTDVVFTCRSGRRAQVAWRQLEPFGYCNIRVYYGSYLDWTAKNGTLCWNPACDAPKPTTTSNNN